MAENLITINKDIDLNVDLASSLNYVNYQAECEAKRYASSKKQNSFSFLRKVGITNRSTKDLLNYTLQFTFSPSFVSIGEVSLSCLEKGRLTEVDSFEIRMEVKSLYEISEAIPGSLFVELKNEKGETVATTTKNLKILPISESASDSRVDEILSSFVTPNDDEVNEVVGKASLILGTKYGSTSFAGYQYHDPNKVMEELDALYLAVVQEGIRYSNPPASFEKTFQRVRLPYEVLKEKVATCLDFSLLFASMAEAVGLKPIIVIINDHALVGVWLDEDDYSSPRIENGTELLNLASKGYNHLSLINIVDAASTPSFNFLEASEDGYKVLEGAKRFDYALDVEACRRERILPLPTPHKLDDGTITVPFPFSKDDSSYETPKIDLSLRRYVSPSAPSSKNKFDYWEEKLLDLTLRNRLINLRFPPSGIQVISSDADETLSFLEANTKLSLCPLALNLTEEEKGYGIISFPKSNYSPFIREAERKKTVLVASKSGNPEDYLKSVSRKSNTTIEECGCNPLFLTLGLIKWFDNEKAAEHGTGAMYAPVFLLPVKMPRRKSGPNYTFEYSFDDFGLNTTIFEYFHQVFGLDFSQIVGKIPTKADGTADIRLVYNFIREKIGDMKGWGLFEEPSTISLFSFAHFVMWNDIRTHRSEMMKNSIVSSLVSGEENWQEPATYMMDELDEKIAPISLAIPLSADSSQIEAIAASSQGASFVLDGPPGTGKSQTIANMIVNFLYHGKSVLFVAEKGVALDVVKRRLDDLGLGQFCLSIPSVITSKSDVLTSIGKLLDLGPVEGPEGFSEAGDEIKKKRESLNATLSKLHEKGSFFVSSYDAIIGYLTLSKYKGKYETSEAYAKSLDKAKFEEAKAALDDLASESHLNGGYKSNAFLPFAKRDYGMEYRDQVFNMAKPFITLLQDLHRETYNCFFKDKGLTETLANVKNYLSIVKILQGNQHIFTDALDDETYVLKKSEIEKYLLLKGELAKERETLLHTFDETIFKKEGKTLLLRYKSMQEASLFQKIRIMHSLQKELSSSAPDSPKLKKKEMGPLLETLASYQNHLIDALTLDPYAIHFFADVNLDTPDLVKEESEAFLRTNEVIGLAHLITPGLSSSYDDIVLAIVHLASDTSYLFDKARNLLLSDYQKLVDLNEKMKADYSFDIFLYPDTLDYFGRAASLLGDALASSGRLSEWVKLLLSLDKASTLVPHELIDLYTSGSISGDDLIPVYSCSLYFRILTISLSADGLSTLTAEETEKEITSYRQKMNEFAKDSVMETAARITSSYPHNSDALASSTSTYQLRKLAKNGGRGVTLRSLFDNYGSLIHTLCPCFLMSPLSVAQYLNPASYTFDAVIFDEASQIPTSEAIGAISRGHSVIIAGDQEQMPPSNYFVSNVGVTADSGNTLDTLDEDLESLLDDAIVLGLPRKRLNWHYRSHHESLIAFSNSKFYENSLYTFPSPRQELASVSFHAVPGVYEKKRGVNRKEAEAIVEEIKRRVNDEELSKLSIGVVTFNEAQQNLIEDLLDKEMGSSSKNPGGEDIFVKNLENVQGDERDVILFSICYAPDKKDGSLSLNFGPLSRVRGERRLNVAVSRAREEMIVFSSIKPEDIRADRAKNDGAQYLKDFLMFASGGVDTLAINARNEIKPSGISVANFLAKDLTKLGYKVKTDLGASSFKVDLGIIDPNDNDHYLLGVICDGDSYCSTLTCRDRNIVQPSILEKLGWKIYRVWSVEYLDHPEEVVKGIVSAINGATENSEAEDVKFGPLLLKKKEINVHPHAIPYRSFLLSSNNLDFSSPFAVNTVANFLLDIIKVEGPISRRMLEDKFRVSFSVGRIGALIKNVFDQALLAIGPSIESCGSARFYWMPRTNMEEYRFYRLNDSSFSRDIYDISFIELGNAIADILAVQGRMSDEDLYKQVSLLYGFESLKEKSRVYLSRALKANSGTRLNIYEENGECFLRG